jgi:hypothetical protein
MISEVSSIRSIDRIMDKPAISIHIPRFMDYFLYENIIRQKNVERDNVCSLFHVSAFELDMLAKLSKNIVTIN